MVTQCILLLPSLIFGQKNNEKCLQNENSCVKALHLNLDYSGKNLKGSKIIHIIFSPCINTLQKILDGYTNIYPVNEKNNFVNNNIDMIILFLINTEIYYILYSILYTNLGCSKNLLALLKLNLFKQTYNS